VGNDQEVEFHEIKIQLFQEVNTSIMRSKFLIMLYFEFQSHNWFVSHKNDHEIKIQKTLLGIWPHDHFVSCKYDHDIKIQNKLFKSSSCTCGKFLALIISHLCIKPFNLMLALAANTLIMRSKLPNNALFWVLISWSIC
jgi:hypothetical protein